MAVKVLFKRGEQLLWKLLGEIKNSVQLNDEGHRAFFLLSLRMSYLFQSIFL